MPKKLTTAVAAKNLANLRLIFLKINELSRISTNSNGLLPEGQTDLSCVFPRTSIQAAIQHAAAVARSEYDDKVRAKGVYHLFRLPTYWEAQIHRATMDGISDSELATAGTVDSAYGLFPELPRPQNLIPPPQGPVDLREIDLTSPRDLANLASQYLSALGARQSVIPFFRLTDA